MRVVTVLVLAVMLSGCALSEGTADIDYVSKASVAAVEGAKDVRVAVGITDARVSNRDRISVKKNGYGMEMASIRASKPVPDIVRAALERELTARGFVLGGGQTLVTVDVVKFWNDFKAGFFSAATVAEVLLNVQIRDTAGQVIYSRLYAGEFTMDPIMVYEVHNAKEALEGAFGNVIQAIMADPAFIEAIKKPAKGAGV